MIRRTLVAATVAAFTGALVFGEEQRHRSAGDCSAVPAARSQGSSRASHQYFEALAARPDCILAYSLRDQSQLQQFQHSKMRPAAVSYDPASDSDPRRQDAAKLMVPANRVSLPNQLRLPMNTQDGTTTLITWDAWFGAEFAHEKTGIGTYKTFQFASPREAIWFEVRTRFSQDEGRQARRTGRTPGQNRAASANRKPGTAGKMSDSNEKKDATADRKTANEPVPPQEKTAPAEIPAAPGGGGRGRIGMVDARAYGGKGAAPGPNVTKSTPLAPQVGSFTVRAETWTRYWVQIVQRENDWDLISLWVSDEEHDAVQILDRLQLSVRGSVEAFWLEYNTSSKMRPGLGPRVSYARNIAILRNVKDAPSLFQRPIR